MPKPNKSVESTDFLGILAMLANVSFVALGAAFAKSLMGELPAGQVLWIRFAGYMVVMTPITFWLHHQELRKPSRIDLHLYRAVLSVAVAFFFLLGLKTLDLAEAVSLFYIYPFLMSIAGIMFLGERGSPQLWTALVVGFVGVALVAQPNFGSARVGLLPILLAAFLVAARLVLHRYSRAQSSPLVTALWERGVGAILVCFMPIAGWLPLASAPLLPLLGLVFASIASQVFLVYAISRAPLVRLAPFAFWEVLFALLIGIAWFGDSIDLIALFGIAILVSSGVLMAAHATKLNAAR